jgi:hypothetical protein
MKHPVLVLPALRGKFGDWIFYSCLMPIGELGSRVSYAKEIHKDKALSQLIQRSLEGPRAKHIADYLKTQERFFNSLVPGSLGRPTGCHRRVPICERQPGHLSDRHHVSAAGCLLQRLLFVAQAHPIAACTN